MEPNSLYRFTCLVIGFLHMIQCEDTDLPSYTVEGQCGNTISRHQTAGTITFDRVSYFTDCLVTVAPEKLRTGPGKVLFYFTEFILPSPCSSLNVAVLDGDNPIFSQHVKGLPNALCGRNTTLTQTGMVFNTTGPKFALLIRWPHNNPLPSASFVLKFASYYDGPCVDSESVTTCASGRCTPSQFHCHDDIDTCGWNETNVCSKEDDDSLLENIGDAIWSFVKNVLILIAFIVVAGFVISIFKGRFRRLTNSSRAQSCCDRLEPCCDRLRSCCERLQSCCSPILRSLAARIQSFVHEVNSRAEPPPVIRPRSPSIHTVEMTQQTAIEDNVNTNSINLSIGSSSESEINNVTRRRSRDDGDNTAPPPSYDSLGLFPSAPPVAPNASSDFPSASIDSSSVPPPSYDEFISNENKYTHDSEV